LAGPQLLSYVLFDIFLLVVLARIPGSLLVRVRLPRAIAIVALVTNLLTLPLLKLFSSGQMPEAQTAD
jgi:hypothetical protein